MPRLDAYAPPSHLIDEVGLDFDLRPDCARVRSRLSLRLNGPAAPLVLNGEAMELVSVAIDGQALEPRDYVLTDKTLTIASTPAAFSLEIETRLDPANNTELQGLYVSGERFYTQCESEGFRRITFFLDRPDVLARYSVRVEADAATHPTLLSNGDLVESGPLADGRHFTVWRDPFPKPCYLFALVAGAFETLTDSFETMSGREVALAFHVDEGNGPRARFAIESLKKAMRWDEEVFGREYDLSQFHVVAVRDFNYGAMENKSLNVFNASALLADVRTETDADFAHVERVVAHEYFHNWTGNRITLRDWFQLCLKEGLTVFRDQEFTADMNSRAVQRIRDVSHLRALQFPEDAGPLAHPPRPSSFEKIENFYTPTVYRKGAEVVRVLKALIGPELFAAGMEAYFQTCDGRAVTVEEFVNCFESVSGQDLGPFLRWYTEAGTPHVEVKASHDPDAGRLTLSVSQSGGEVRPIPLKVGFIAAEDGRELTGRLDIENEPRPEHSLILSNPQFTWTFEGLHERAVPAVMRGFMAPVRVDDGLSHSDRLVQMAHDLDPFTRWDAGRRLLIAAAEELAKAETGTTELVERILDALGRELARADGDPAFAAFALTAPSLGELIQEVAKPDPDLLFEGRRRLQAALAERFEDPLLARVEGAERDDGGRSSRAIGVRALGGAAMHLLAALGGVHAGRFLKTFRNAQSMTVSLAALNALAESGDPNFEVAVGEFEARWRDEPLVMDKWFSVQASAPHGEVFERIERLTRHPAFTLKNPNRARSVYAAFANSNLRAFNDLSGKGYRLVASAVEQADSINPLLASRFVRAFEGYRKLDDGRHALVRSALEPLTHSAGISDNQRELIARLL